MDGQEPCALRIACCNHKGGVGKTTCAVNLAAGLRRAGWRVLVVDVDPQAHLTASLGLAAADGGLAAVLGDNAPVAGCIMESGDLFVLPASARLADVETQLSRQEAPDALLAQALAKVPDIDAVFFDCPPHLGPLTRQVLDAATGVIVPMTPDFLSMQSLAWLMDTLSGLATGPQGRAPSVTGILLNRFSARKRLHREVRHAVAGHFPGISFETPIRENVALAEAPSHGQDIFRYAPTSAGAQDFSAVCRELARRLGEPDHTAA